MCISHSCNFFCEVSVQIFAHLKNALVVSLLSCNSSSYILDTSPLSDLCIANIFPYSALSFHFLKSIFLRANFKILIKFSLSISFLMKVCFYVLRHFCLFLYKSRSFLILGFTFMYIIHFESIFTCSVK